MQPGIDPPTHAQEDPASAQKHMAHPDVAAKMEKLVAAGIVRLG